MAEIRAFVVERYRELDATLDPLLDARLLTTVGAALDGAPSPADPGARQSPLWRSLSAAWDDTTSPGVPLDEVLWGPRDRVPFPARPPGRPRPEAGARGHMISSSRLEEGDIAGELNDNVMAELCALELLCRCSYEHPDLPWSSHLALARHATDEERHAAIFRRLLTERGCSEEALPQHGCNYEHAYEFPECEVGGKRELVWRLLILCTVLEGLALDKLPVEIGTRDVLGQTDFARALDYIATDELFHVENGLRLTRQLCAEHGFDPILDRERVHGRFFGRQRDVRRRRCGRTTNVKAQLNRLVTLDAEHEVLEVQDDVGDILLDPRYGGELVERVVEANLSDRRARDGRQQGTAQAGAERVAEARFERGDREPRTVPFGLADRFHRGPLDDEHVEFLLLALLMRRSPQPA